MARVTRQFFLGCGAGFLLAIATLFGGVAASMVLFKDYYVQATAGQLRTPPITSGLKADYAWSVRSADGHLLDMAETQGKAVFLNFWHPACTACLAEIPSINRLCEALQAEIDENRLVVVCVSTGTPEGLERAVEDEGVRFPAYTLEGKRPEVYDAKQGPITFIIAPGGDIVFKHVGGARWDDEAALSYLRLLAQPAPAVQ